VLFTTLDFALFLPIVFSLYWWASRFGVHAQNLLIVLASYLFYGWWDWRFLFLIFSSTVVDFVIAKALGNNSGKRKRKLLLLLSCTVNLGLLGFFKYYNFFIDTFVAAFSYIGMPFSPSSLQILLPVGISFYTFQTLSYTIDIYRQKLKPTRDFIAFSAFVSFFPQLVAGPIERATHFLPQFFKSRHFSAERAVDGLRQIGWGLVKKVVIADNCARFADLFFSTGTSYTGSALFLGAVFFAFQIYGDFSGYSDIAIGTARLFGFELKQNFNVPYFSRTMAEFWRRWHISLSSWFRDYVYIPLGGSRCGRVKQIRNVCIVFLLSGLWHGAGWTFVLWGAIHAVLCIPALFHNSHRKQTGTVAQGRLLPRFTEQLHMALTFCLVTITWVFFRAESIPHALEYLHRMSMVSLAELPRFPDRIQALRTLALVCLFLGVEWWGRHRAYAIEGIGCIETKSLRILCYYALLAVIVFLGNFSENPFIYFQF